MAPQRFPILFITASRIGDAVLSSGLIRALTDQIEGARFTIAASAVTFSLTSISTPSRMCFARFRRMSPSTS